MRVNLCPERCFSSNSSKVIFLAVGVVDSYFSVVDVPVPIDGGLVLGGVCFKIFPLSSLSLYIKKNNLKLILCCVLFYFMYIYVFFYL
jgi:hypothetical protein